MKDSFFIQTDKKVEQKFALFNDPDFTDIQYHEQFPTIYHLRYDLINKNGPFDVRLVYLACHHIMKHRGHFLFSGNELNATSELKGSLSNVRDYLEERDVEFWDESQDSQMESVLRNESLTRSDKNRSLVALVASPSSVYKEVCRLLAGLSVDPSKIFENVESEDGKSVKCDFSKDYDEKRDEISSLIGDGIELIDELHSIYNWFILAGILGDDIYSSSPSISKRRLNIHDEHSRDLKALKQVLRHIDESYDNHFFDDCFKISKNNKNNYVAFTGHLKLRSGANAIVLYRCDHELFLKYLTGMLEPLKEDPLVKPILEKIEKKHFLQKITSSGNGVVPRQLHYMELKQILEKASSYLPFLKDDTQSKILQTFNFRVPYYVGPFNDQVSWIQRRSNEPIRPWNFKEIVDLEATAEGFIRELTNKCTYLSDQDVLPKQSLLYSEFLVRNAINMLTVDGQRLDQEYRDGLYETLFENRTKSGKITKKRVASALKCLGLDCGHEMIGGMDIEIPAQLKARLDFKRIVGDKLSDQQIESIIHRITVFPENDGVLTNWLINQFGSILNEEELQQIRKLKYSGWGTLSRKLLTGVKHLWEDGVERSIIESMRSHPVVLMELLSKEYTYAKQIDELNQSLLGDTEFLTYDDLDVYRLSPSVKKMVWQTLKICREVSKIMGGAPGKIFVEVTRQTETNKVRTSSRKTQLNNLYKECQDDCADLINQLNHQEEDSLRGKKLYLYYLQKGRCMYSGDIIDLNDLLTDASKYDIDHIYPRSYTKDDSLNNTVLVKQSLNRDKSDTYPIDVNIRTKQLSFWQTLLRQKFISLEKFNRLSSPNQLSPEQIDKFIARQLVETSQSTKAVASILSQIAVNSDVVYVKAGHVSDFRYRHGTRDDAVTQFYFPKIREINDLHHAKDAYLNIVVGNCYDTKFTKRFFAKDWNRQYNLVKFFDREIRDGSDYSWLPGPQGTIRTVEQMMRRNNVLISYESYRQTDGFYDQMLQDKSKGKGLGKSPIKTSDERFANTSQYGAYNKVTGSYFALIEHVKNKKAQKMLVSIPLLLAVCNPNNEDLIQYCQNELGLKSVSVLVPEIKYWSILEIDGVRYRLLAKTSNNIKCGIDQQPFYSQEYEVEIKKLSRFNSVDQSERLARLSDIQRAELNDDANEIFKQLVEKFRSKPFSYVSSYANQGEKCHDLMPEFYTLTIENKLKLIFNLHRLLTGEGAVVDLSDLYSLAGKADKKQGAQSGMVTIAMKLNNSKKYSLIDKSITGFFEMRREI